MNLFDVPENYTLPWYFGMTSPSEQAYCWHHAKNEYTGEGDWLELGTFLGSLTLASGQGMRLNPAVTEKEMKIRVFDLFYFDFTMVDCITGTEMEGKFEEKEWYVDKYRKIVEPVGDLLQINKADLTGHEYSGEPIEFIIVDVIKYEALAQNVTNQFFPHLMPGKARIFQQDFLHFYEAWVTLQMHAIRDAVSLETVVDNSASVVFKLDKEPNSLPVFPDDSADIDPEQVIEAFDWSRSLMPEKFHPCVHAAQVMMHVHCSDFDRAQKLNQQMTEWGLDEHYEVIRLRDHLRGMKPELLS